MISKKLLAVGVGAVALGLSLTIAGPASAAQTRTLPAGESLFGIDCQTGYLNGQLGTFDTTSGVATLIGSGSTDSHAQCAEAAAYDSKTGKVYWVGYDTHELFSMDPTTGDSTYIGPMETSPSSVNFVGALMIGTDGILYAVYNFNDVNDQRLGTVDVTTGTITYTHELLDGATPLTDVALYSGAYNPADGKYYVINGFELYEIDVTNGALTDKGYNGEDHTWYGLAFDSNGVMWSTGEHPIYSTTVSGWATPGVEQSSDNRTTFDSDDWYSESLFIIPASLPTPPATEEPALATTGTNGTQAGLLAAGGAVLALLGAGVVVASRRRKVNN